MYINFPLCPKSWYIYDMSSMCLWYAEDTILLYLLYSRNLTIIRIWCFHDMSLICRNMSMIYIRESISQHIVDKRKWESVVILESIFNKIFHHHASIPSLSNGNESYCISISPSVQNRDISKIPASFLWYVFDMSMLCQW